jgi:hypothetical protein
MPGTGAVIRMEGLYCYIQVTEILHDSEKMMLWRYQAPPNEHQV